MKVTLTLLLFFSIFFPEIIQEDTSGHRGLASSWTIIPARSLAGLHYIFKGFTIDEVAELLGDSKEVARIYARITNLQLHKSIKERLG